MLNPAGARGQRVRNPLSVTPGGHFKYGVEQSHEEVVACLMALCAELTKSDGPIEDLSGFAKIMQTKNLYHCVQRHIGTENPTQMQSFIEPNSVSYIKDEGLSLSKKYRNYSRGKNFPNQATLDRIFAATGRNWAETLDPVLWSVLDLTVKVGPDETLRKYAEGLEGCNLKSAIHYCKYEKHEEKFQANCRSQLRTPGMHALASLIFLLRLAHEVGNQDAAAIAASTLATKLMVMGSELQQRGTAGLFFRLAVHHLFPLAEQWEVNVSPSDLAKKSMLLNLVPFCSGGSDATNRIAQAAREETMVEWHGRADGHKRLLEQQPRGTLLSPPPPALTLPPFPLLSSQCFL